MHLLSDTARELLLTLIDAMDRLDPFVVAYGEDNYRDLRRLAHKGDTDTIVRNLRRWPQSPNITDVQRFAIQMFLEVTVAAQSTPSEGRPGRDRQSHAIIRTVVTALDYVGGLGAMLESPHDAGNVMLELSGFYYADALTRLRKAEPAPLCDTRLLSMLIELLAAYVSMLWATNPLPK